MYSIKCSVLMCSIKYSVVMYSIKCSVLMYSIKCSVLMYSIKCKRGGIGKGGAGLEHGPAAKVFLVNQSV